MQEVMAKEKENIKPPHIGWKSFRSVFEPSGVFDKPSDLFKTSEILDKLNAICDDEYCTEKHLFEFMADNGFSEQNIDGSDLWFWRLNRIGKLPPLTMAAENL